MTLIKRFCIWIDQGANLFIRLSDGWGWPDETLSARAWRLRDQYPRLHVWIDRLFFFDPNHCYESWRSELLRAQLPVSYRSKSP